MTTNTPAPAQQDFVASELRGIIEVCGDSPTAIVSVERMRLWLSKLRAPVADERAAFLLEEALGYIRSFAIPGKTAEDMTAIAQAGMRRFNAALASAPVAGEAQPAIGYLKRDKGRTEWSITRAAYDVPDGIHMLYAAPQASEAVRDADVSALLAFMFERFGQPGDAGELPDSVVAAVRRLERAALSAQPGAQKEQSNA